MKTDKEYKLQIGQGLDSVEVEARDIGKLEHLHASPDVALKSLKALRGADQILAKMPRLETLSAWFPVAIFCVCVKLGTARYLDIWDADHFDGFTDMRANLNDCRAWFSAEGYTGWGSTQSKTGRINCYFEAPTAGDYVCVASLQSYPDSSTARVECRIDDFSFGPLTWPGTIHQPHPCNLNAGFHHFRIWQQTGSFFFLGLDVYKV